MVKSEAVDENIDLPTFGQLEQYLKAYGWTYRVTTAGDGKKILLAPYLFEGTEDKAVLVGFRIEGEFVMVSTIGFLYDIPVEAARELLEINDTVKLVKLYTVSPSGAEKLEAEVGFELWAEAWNKDTMAAFMDMLCMGIERVKEEMSDSGIAYRTKYVEFGPDEKAD